MAKLEGRRRLEILINIARPKVTSLRDSSLCLVVQEFVNPADDEVIDNEEDIAERILATGQPIPDEDSDEGIFKRTSTSPSRS